VIETQAPRARRTRRRPRALAALIDEVLRRTDADLKDEEAVHDLRVACRRLEAGTRVNGDVLPRRRLRELRDSAKTIRRAFDRARDLEVIAAELAHVPELSDGFRAAVRDEAEQHAGSVRQRGKVTEALDTLRQARARLGDDAVPPTAALAATLREHAAAFFDELARLRPESSDEALHRARISTKKLRYEMEIATPVLRRLPAQVKRLKRLQDILGRHQDAAVGLLWAEELTTGELNATTEDRTALMRYYDRLGRQQRRLLRRLLEGWGASDMRGRFQRAAGGEVPVQVAAVGVQ
jgi:CHAD domain-containing protein